MKKYLLYPWGAGGYWLRHLLSTAEQGLKEMSLPKGQNFHATASNDWLDLTHFRPHGPYFVLSGLCKFNLYLNTTYKLRVEDNFNGFCNQELWQQIFELGNDANWRLAQAYVETFETHIDIHYKNIMHDPAQLRTELLTLDLPQTVLQNLTLDLVTQSCRAFTNRCPNVYDHIGNVDSLAWLGWCQGAAVNMCIDIPVKIDKNLMGYKQWLKDNNRLFIDFTKPYIL